eukprot:Amastigsp_a842419_14.p4 type:complete len:171 gc:universal Amastigsp_a842419_14:649-137(-)
MCPPQTCSSSSGRTSRRQGSLFARRPRQRRSVRCTTPRGTRRLRRPSPSIWSQPSRPSRPHAPCSGSRAKASGRPCTPVVRRRRLLRARRLRARAPRRRLPRRAVPLPHPLLAPQARQRRATRRPSSSGVLSAARLFSASWAPFLQSTCARKPPAAPAAVAPKPQAARCP